MPIHTILVAPEVRNHPHLNQLVAAAETTLRDTLAITREPIIAKWDLLSNEKNQPLLTLTLHDQAGMATVTRVWSEQGLESSYDLEWGLLKQTDQLLKQLYDFWYEKVLAAPAAVGE